MAAEIIVLKTECFAEEVLTNQTVYRVAYGAPGFWSYVYFHQRNGKYYELEFTTGWFYKEIEETIISEFIETWQTGQTVTIKAYKKQYQYTTEIHIPATILIYPSTDCTSYTMAEGELLESYCLEESQTESFDGQIYEYLDVGEEQKTVYQLISFLDGSQTGVFCLLDEVVTPFSYQIVEFVSLNLWKRTIIMENILDNPEAWFYNQNIADENSKVYLLEGDHVWDEGEGFSITATETMNGTYSVDKVLGDVQGDFAVINREYTETTESTLCVVNFTSQGPGTTERRVYSDGEGGITTEDIPNSAACGFTPPVTEDIIGKVIIPIANSLRFVYAETNNGCNSFQTPDNTLFANQYWPGRRRYCYHQKVQKCDVMTIQFRSTYATNSYKVVDRSGSVVETNPATLKVTDMVFTDGQKIYEFTINWNNFAVGYYKVIIECTDPEFGTYTAESEPVDLRTFFQNTSLVRYKNTENNYGIDYSTGIIHMLRVTSVLYEQTWPGKTVVQINSHDQMEKLADSVYRQLKFETFTLPIYLHEKLAIAFSHDYFTVNGVKYQTDQRYQPAYIRKIPVANGNINIQQVDFYQQNTHDTGVLVQDPLLAQETGFIKL